MTKYLTVFIFHFVSFRTLNVKNRTGNVSKTFTLRFYSDHKIKNKTLELHSLGAQSNSG